jgi:c-di-GMP-binding flagellar brake protein YcgR
LGTRVFFFKSEILKDQKGFYIQDNITIYELCRRKHERFNIPKEFMQSCTIQADMNKNIRAHIVDLSESGIRLQIKSSPIDYKPNDLISFSFQIEKRAEIMTQGHVRYLKKDGEGILTLGLEFHQLTPLLINKIKNVCEDLERNLKIKTRIA